MGTGLNAGDVSFGDRPFVFGDRPFIFGNRPYKMSVFFGDRPCEEAFILRGQTLRNAVFSMGTDPSKVGEANNFRESC